MRDSAGKPAEAVQFLDVQILRFEMLARAVAVSLAGLSHQVVDEDLRRT
jgi:hypothetical protein